MIGWLLKKLGSTAPAGKPVEPTRAASPENCALWHDVTRALDAKLKAAIEKGSAK